MPSPVNRAEFARLCGVSRMAVTKQCRTRLRDALVGDGIDPDHPAAAAYRAQKRGATSPSLGVSDTASDIATRCPPPTAAAEPGPPPPADPTPPRSPTAEPALPPPSPPTPPTPKPSVSVSPPPPSAAEELGLEAWPPPPPAAAPRPSPPVPNVWDRVDVEQYADWTLRQIADQFGTVIAFKDWLDARKKQVQIREKELRNSEIEGTLISREAVRTHLFSHIDETNRRLLQDVPKTIARRVYALARSDTPVEDAERLVREILSSELRPVKERVARTLRDVS